MLDATKERTQPMKMFSLANFLPRILTTWFRLISAMPMLEAMVCLSLYVIPYTTRMQLFLQEWRLPSKSTSSQSSKELVHDQKNVLGSWMRHLHCLPIWH